MVEHTIWRRSILLGVLLCFLSVTNGIQDSPVSDQIVGNEGEDLAFVSEVRSKCPHALKAQVSVPKRHGSGDKPKSSMELVFGSTEAFSQAASKSSHCEQKVLRELITRFEKRTGKKWKNVSDKQKKLQLLKPSHHDLPISEQSLLHALDPESCPYPTEINCTGRTMYRTYDGSCNDPDKPIMGATRTPYRRIGPATYADDISEPRRAVDGGELPSARRIVLEYFNDLQKPSSHLSLLFPMFGQFVSHDLVKTSVDLNPNSDLWESPASAGSSSSETEADCGPDGCETEGEGKDMCYPIEVFKKDPDFTNQQCLRNIRSTQVPALDCMTGPVSQLSMVTHWLDGSSIYGESVKRNEQLRDKNDATRGRLLMHKHPKGPEYKDMLPLLKEVQDVTGLVEDCVLAGDDRASMNDITSVFHVMWAREHNYLESVLHALNPHWNGERLYEETRRLVIAFLQHITYNEYLPVLLGPEFTKKYSLSLLQSGYLEGQDSNLDARICTEFATAAHRFGHSMIADTLDRVKDGQINKDLYVSSTMFTAKELFNTAAGGVDGLAEGAALQNSGEMGCAFSKQLTRSLFTPDPPHGLGLDLASADIQRGRDNGLPPYNVLRAAFGLKSAKDFKDLGPAISDERIKGLKKLYKHVDDIDLFVGGLSEVPVAGGTVGEIFAAVIADNFHRLRVADRFWYESRTAGFNEEQLKAIREITLTEILCRNSDDIKSLQRMTLKKADDAENQKVDCKSFKEFDISAWKENPE